MCSGDGPMTFTMAAPAPRHADGADADRTSAEPSRPAAATTRPTFSWSSILRGPTTTTCTWWTRHTNQAVDQQSQRQRQRHLVQPPTCFQAFTDAGAQLPPGISLRSAPTAAACTFSGPADVYARRQAQRRRRMGPAGPPPPPAAAPRLAGTRSRGPRTITSTWWIRPRTRRSSTPTMCSSRRSPRRCRRDTTSPGMWPRKARITPWAASARRPSRSPRPPWQRRPRRAPAGRSRQPTATIRPRLAGAASRGPTTTTSTWWIRPRTRRSSTTTM